MSRTVSRSYIFVQWNLVLNLIGTHKRLKDLACLHLSPTISDGLGGSACMMSPATAKSLQSCPTLCNPIDSSPPGSPVPGILQARPLKCVAISFSNAWKWKMKVKPLSRIQLLVTPWTTAYQAPLSMGLSRQEYWSGVPLPSLTVALAHCKHFRNTG